MRIRWLWLALVGAGLLALAGPNLRKDLAALALGLALLGAAGWATYRVILWSKRE